MDKLDKLPPIPDNGSPFPRQAFYDLADELEKSNDPKYDEFIRELRALEFDDFANNKYAASKMAMHEIAKSLGRMDIALRVENGDFDQ